MTRTPNFTEAELGWIFQFLRALNTVYVKPPENDSVMAQFSSYFIKL